MLKLESIPIGWDGWAYLNEPRPQEDRQPQRQAAQHRGHARPSPSSSSDHGGTDLDEIPF
jgi:hypothetical protein